MENKIKMALDTAKYKGARGARAKHLSEMHKKVAGPGLGHHGDYAQFDDDGKFTGIEMKKNDLKEKLKMALEMAKKGGGSRGARARHLQSINKK